MTLFPRYWPREDLLSAVPAVSRLFPVTPESRLLGICHWQAKPRHAPTLILVHGLEGCSESHYMRGIAAKAWRRGLNVIRLNQRNCGSTEHLTPTLYHSGLSQDIRAVVSELAEQDGLSTIYAAGYSMGGNLVLKMAGEVGHSIPALAGVIGVCPNIEPAACVEALLQPQNWLYHRHFLVSLKARLRRKARLFPGKFDLGPLTRIRTMREFDDVYTAPDGGFASADDYYTCVAAARVLESVAVPTLIITAQDDPFIPFAIFQREVVRTHPHLRLWAPLHGGHCAFVQRAWNGEDRYWAENRIVEWVTGNARVDDQERVLDG